MFTVVSSQGRRGQSSHILVMLRSKIMGTKVHLVR
jgi:hypothetical protein